MARARKQAGVEQLRRVREELERGWPVGLTVLTGDDLYHLDRAQKLLLESLTRGEAEEFGVTVFGEEMVDVATVVAAARSVGMFSPRRVVFVRDVTALEGGPEPLEAYAESPPPRSHLIVRAPALDRRRKLHQALAGRLARRLDFDAVAGAGGRNDAQRMAGEKGLRLDSAGAAWLVELVGGDLYRLDRELEKLRAWLGGEGRVGADAVRQVAAGSGLLSGWEVAEAVTLRDRPAGLAAARQLVRSGDEALRTVGGVAWRARVMLQAKALLAEGRRPDEVVRATRAFYFRDSLMRGLERYTLSELLAFPAALLRADRTLKSRSILPATVVEHLVDRLTGAHP